MALNPFEKCDATMMLCGLFGQAIRKETTDTEDLPATSIRDEGGTRDRGSALATHAGLDLTSKIVYEPVPHDPVPRP